MVLTDAEAINVEPPAPSELSELSRPPEMTTKGRPKEFICRLSGKLLLKAVTAADGYSYDRLAPNRNPNLALSQILIPTMIGWVSQEAGIRKPDPYSKPPTPCNRLALSMYLKDGEGGVLSPTTGRSYNFYKQKKDHK